MGSQLLSASHPTCLKFYENTASLAALPAAQLTDFSVADIAKVAGVSVPGVPGIPGVGGLPGVPDVPGASIPKRPSFGGKMLKTVALGALSGVVGGGVSAIGIDNNFWETMLVGTASQITYDTGETVYDSIVGGAADGSAPKDPTIADVTAAAEGLTPAGATSHDSASHNIADHRHLPNGTIERIVPAGQSAAATDAAAAASPLATIQAAADIIGCPAPDAASIIALK